MPRTRIRRGQKLTVNTGGSQTGDNTNPVGSSLTTDSIGSIDIDLNELANTPGDAATFLLNVVSTDVVLSPTEESLFFAIMQSLADPVVTPVEADAFQVVAGATTVTQTVGTGWQTPTNAQGLNNGTNATINSPAGLGASAVSGTLVGSYDSLGAPAETVTGVVTLRFYSTLTVGLLGSGSLALAFSTDGGANYTTVGTKTTTDATQTATDITLPIANLGNLRFRVTATVTGSATGASSATLDAVTILYNLTGV